jgi:tetratricopeptide (TPR) repeat protein
MTASHGFREAALALQRGDALHALGLVGRDHSAEGLTVRGIAYAQLGDLELARECLSRGATLTASPLARARIGAALAEIRVELGEAALAAREAESNAIELARLGDSRNAWMQRLVLARAEVLLGHAGEARRTVDSVLTSELPDDVRAVAALARAEIAVRGVAPTRAKEALRDLERLLARAPHELLARAAKAMSDELTAPVARILEGGTTRDADLYAIEAASSGEKLLVDACRRLVLAGRAVVPLSRRPVLFALVYALAHGWPHEVSRDALVLAAFDVRKANATHRARLRVEASRLREALRGIAEVRATGSGYRLRSERSVLVLLPRDDQLVARVGMLLSDGASWSALALAEHAGLSKRTVQRALSLLVDADRVVRTGKGRGVRYATAGARIASRMLLLGLLPSD